MTLRPIYYPSISFDKKMYIKQKLGGMFYISTLPGKNIDTPVNRQYIDYIFEMARNDKRKTTTLQLFF